ncbi:MAG: restriction endonuclease subunit R [Verrucomicrobiia bacterium Tous-C3TDCM]|nr:MAG: restriction endonuclease subunit R [Verrucomicrobiae bacterium Tous-C3TDCM]PAZ05692.1 MAG: restriction endonuclease subunit R [Verrucomicrobiae bacterium AMD-G2]
MKGFNFEKDLPHQQNAVKSVVSVFADLQVDAAEGAHCLCKNPLLNREAPYTQFSDNVWRLQKENGIKQKYSRTNIVDIMMETGTGKTYTYAKTIFELNKEYGIFKFVVVVPTLPIKAGTVNFLKSESSRAHFREQYGKSIKLHIVESLKSGKANKKTYMPPSVISFCNAGSHDRQSIEVMVINAGMLNSETMQKSYDKDLFDQYTVAFAGIAAVRPLVIIDEPHKFSQQNATWENIQRMKPQYILRYGATFPEKEIKKKDEITGKMVKESVKDYHNLIYTLSAVDSFNQNLVKGVIGHISEFESGKDALVRLVSTDGSEANFELYEQKKRSTMKLGKKGSLEQIHPAMSDLIIESLNKSKVVLSNGMELKVGDKLNPYSYAQTLQEMMLRNAVAEHFKLERDLLKRDIKIKPLTLFFIDNIEEYRAQDGYLRQKLEEFVRAEAENILKTEKAGYYRSYLEKTLEDVSVTHAGYFSQDNTDKDEAVEKEVNEILHDKEAMLSLQNPRRFIFSKWTLREGWDNPNVFQICKLRSSGSEISKLQEVGRGLRLPVNEFGNRVKEEQFFLNYFVDFTESDFVDKLVTEINKKSGAVSMEESPERLTETLIKQICDKYKISEDQLLEVLDQNNVITRTNAFKEGGFDFVKQHYGMAFAGVNTGKVRKASDVTRKVTIRTEKYPELKALWEKINEKVVLEYKFKNEEQFQSLLSQFFQTQERKFQEHGIRSIRAQIEIDDGQATVRQEPESIYEDKLVMVPTMSYDEFLQRLSATLHISRNTLHAGMVSSQIPINQYLNGATVRIIKKNFEDYLMYHAIDKFSVEYKKISNCIHPTKMTSREGEVLKEMSAAGIGVMYADEKVADSYFFDELYYDSELEKENVKKELQEVVVFTKIPKNSIKIPVAGGKSYSPDFAYVLKYGDGSKKLNFIVETKNVVGDSKLRDEERQKLRHAEQFFQGNVTIKFRTQFTNDKIQTLLKEIVGGK